MKQRFTFLFLLFTFMSFSQDGGEDTLDSIARKLYEKELLSKKGMEYFIQWGKTDEAADYLQAFMIESNDDISPQYAALAFLSMSFDNAMQVRSGMIHHQLKMYIDRLGSEYGQSERGKEELAKMKKLMQDIEREMEYEAAIPDDENIMLQLNGLTTIGLGLHFDMEIGMIHPRRSATGKHLRKTLNDLLELNLVHQLVFEEFNQVLNHPPVTNFDTEGLMISYCIMRQHFYNHYDENLKYRTEFIRKLVNKKKIDGHVAEEFIASIPDYELPSYYDILSLFDEIVPFEEDTISKIDLDFYQDIIQKIPGLLGDVPIRNLTIEYKDESEGTYRRGVRMTESLYIDLEINGEPYSSRHEGWYTPPMPALTDEEFKEMGWTEEAYDNYMKSMQQLHNNFLHIGFYQVFNKWLSDTGRDERIHMISKEELDGDGMPKNKYYHLVLLDEETMNIILNEESWDTDFICSEEDYRRPYPRKKIKGIFDELESIGLFSHYSETEKKEALDGLYRDEFYDDASLMYALPKTVVYFDWETGNYINPYEELTLQFAEISRGLFQPEHIIDEMESHWEEKTTPYGFDFMGESYFMVMPMMADWLSPDFIVLIEKALAENKIDGKIYMCSNDEQASGYIFLTEKQHRFFSEKYPGFLEAE